MNMAADYKDWIQGRAEDIADSEYENDFHSLSAGDKDIVYSRACEDYQEHVAGLIDAERERRKTADFK